MCQKTTDHPLHGLRHVKEVCARVCPDISADTDELLDVITVCRNVRVKESYYNPGCTYVPGLHKRNLWPKDIYYSIFLILYLFNPRKGWHHKSSSIHRGIVWRAIQGVRGTLTKIYSEHDTKRQLKNKLERGALIYDIISEYRAHCKQANQVGALMQILKKRIFSRR